MAKPILCLDFDGVCNTYQSGWQGIDVCNDPPVPGLEVFLEDALQYFEVYIYSSRSHYVKGREAIELWFYKWVREDLRNKLVFPDHKPPAMIALDDRALLFTGTWPEAEELSKFVPWTKNSNPPYEKGTRNG